MENVSKAIEFLSRPSPNLEDDAFLWILGSLDHLSSLKIIDPLQIQTAISNDYLFKSGLNKTPVTSESILKALGFGTCINYNPSTNCVEWNNIKCLAIIVHGPLIEKDRMASPLTSLSVNPNNHWSLLTWFIESNTIYHFDSIRPGNRGFNREKAQSILHLLLSYSLVPQSISSLIEPIFFPLQTGGWECGYHVLIVLELLDKCALKFADLQEKINSLKPKLENITKTNNFVKDYFLSKMNEKLLCIQYGD